MMEWMVNQEFGEFTKGISYRFFVHTLEYSEAVVKGSEPEHILQLHEKLVTFLNITKQPAIFVLLIKLTQSEHWITLVAHTPDPTVFSQRKESKFKSGVSLTKLYYLDSANISHLSKPLGTLPQLVLNKIKDKIKT